MGHRRAHHLTPEDIALVCEISEQEVLAHCDASNVPVFHGKVDAALFSLATGLGPWASEITGDSPAG